MQPACTRQRFGPVFFLPALLLPVALGAAAPSPLTDSRVQAWSPSFATTLAWHDNATNAERSVDVIPAAQLLADLSFSHRLLLSRHDSLLVIGRVGAESWPRFDGLDRAGPGIRGILQHKFALGAFAPTLRLETTGDLVFARESARGGRAGSIALNYRQRLLPSLVAGLGHERARYDARALAFDRTGAETTALVAWQSDTAWHFDLALRDRRGTVLSYSSPPRPDLVASGKRLVFVDTFARVGPLIAYYFPARTRSAEIRASRAFGRDYSVAFAASWRKTTHGINSSYLNRVFSTALVRQL